MFFINYWEKRAVEEEKQIQDNATHAAQVVASAYNDSEQYLLAEYVKLLKRMKRRTGWTNERIHEFLNQKASDEELADLVSLRNQTKDKATLKLIKARLNAEALKHRITHLDVIKAKGHIVAMQTLPVHKNAMDSLLTGTVRDAYFSGQVETIARQALDGEVTLLSELKKHSVEVVKYKGNAYYLDVEKQKARLKALPTKEVKQIINTKWNGSNYSKRIWSNTNRLAERLEKLFTMKELASMTERDMAKVLAYEFQVSRGIAERLIRTEANRVYNQGKLNGWREHFPDGEYRFVAVLDKRTSSICRVTDGKIFKVAKAKVGQNLPPLHPWCRSTVVLWFGSSEWQTTRQVPDPYDPNELITINKQAGWAGVERELKKQQKRLEAPKPYVSVKDEWLKNKKEGGEVVDLTHWKHKGVKYKVDGKKVVLDYSVKEKEVAEWLAKTFGKKVQMVPRVNEPDEIKTPDYLIDGVAFDLKEITGSGKNVIDGNLRKSGQQSNNFIIDISKTALSLAEIFNQIESIFKSDKRKVEELMLIKNNQVIEILKKV